MPIFKKQVTLEALNKMSANTMLQHLGIQFINIADGTIEARMPVDHRTHQPFGILHGGASVALAETLVSVAAMCCLDESTQYRVGLDINTNHIKSVREGFVTGRVKPMYIGK